MFPDYPFLVTILGSKEIDRINDNTDVYYTDKDLYLSEKESEERLLEGIQSANALKAWADAEKADGTTITVIIQENEIKETFGKRFADFDLDFDFFKHPVYRHGLKEDFIVRFE